MGEISFSAKKPRSIFGQLFILFVNCRGGTGGVQINEAFLIASFPKRRVMQPYFVFITINMPLVGCLCADSHTKNQFNLSFPLVG